MPKNWTSKKIQLELEQKGAPKLSELASRNGLPPFACYFATHTPHKGAEAVIAKALGVPAHHIWPTRYDSAGRRLSPQPSRNYKTNGGRMHRQKRVAG